MINSDSGDLCLFSSCITPARGPLLNCDEKERDAKTLSSVEISYTNCDDKGEDCRSTEHCYNNINTVNVMNTNANINNIYMYDSNDTNLNPRIFHKTEENDGYYLTDDLIYNCCDFEKCVLSSTFINEQCDDTMNNDTTAQKTGLLSDIEIQENNDSFCRDIRIGVNILNEMYSNCNFCKNSSNLQDKGYACNSSFFDTCSDDTCYEERGANCRMTQTESHCETSGMDTDDSVRRSVPADDRFLFDKREMFDNLRPKDKMDTNLTSSNTSTEILTLNDQHDLTIASRNIVDAEFVNPVKAFVNKTKVKQLKFMSLNVGSIKGKLKYPDFHEYVKHFDILCFTETKLCDTDHIDIEGYLCFMKNRRSFKRKSGGIAVLVRADLISKITFVEHNSYADKIDPTLHAYYRFVERDMTENCMFFEMKLETNDLNSKTVVCAVMYAPPSNSPYANPLIYEEIEEAMLLWSDEGIEHMQMGDMNARCGLLKDYVEESDENGYMPMSEIMDAFQITKERHTMDKMVNSYGDLLSQFCIGQSLLIANGRVGEDAGYGHLTCKDASLVDYLLASPSLFKRIQNFRIDEFDECLSDVHCPVIFTLDYDNIGVSKTNHKNKQEINENRTESKPNWDQKHEKDFLDKIDTSAVNQITNQLKILSENIDHITQKDIDEITNDICQTMTTSAKQLGMIKEKGKRSKNVNKQDKKRQSYPWFDSSCKIKRACFRKAKLHAKRYKTEITRVNKRNAEKEYKRSISVNYSHHQAALQREIRHLRSSNPKEYWNVINREAGNGRQFNDNNKPDPDTFVDHFDLLGNVPDSELMNGINEPRNEVNYNTTVLNKRCVPEEVGKCITKLKNNKAGGCDLIINEFLKCSAPKLLEPISNLFDIILTCGKVPEAWTIGTICPIYKGKGCAMNVDNYRGITLLSCLGKLFTSMINNRINEFLEENDLLGQEQAGFRKEYGTIDHIFSLHCLIDLYLQRKKRLYCTFVDYRKAFDKVQRNILWDKLLKVGIRGNVLEVIKDMYSKAKSCVKTSEGLSRYFSCNIGVRQGENLSPVLFALFLNDLKEFLADKFNGLRLPLDMAVESSLEDIEHYMHLFLLMYADDTVILAETPDDMQGCLNALEVYCKNNGLYINTTKTKVVIFSRGKIRILPGFTFNGEPLEVVWDYKYLGIVFNFNNKFTVAKKSQCTIANKAMFGLIRKCKRLALPLDIQLDLFEKCIVPILLYGCEVWSHENLDICERMQLRFFKIILNLRKTTPTCMVLGELGIFPVSLDAKCKMLTFWYKLTKADTSGSQKISAIMLRLCRILYETTEYKMSWLQGVHTVLNNLGLSEFWFQAKDMTMSVERFKAIVKQRLQDQFLQRWGQEVYENAICLNYRIYKDEFMFENYLTILSPRQRTILLRFRTSNHRLPIQILRQFGVDRERRVCTLCNTNDIGDEFHYLFCCTHNVIVQKRLQYLPRYFQQHANAIKFAVLMKTKSKKKLLSLCKFVEFIMALF